MTVRIAKDRVSHEAAQNKNAQRVTCQSNARAEPLQPWSLLSSAWDPTAVEVKDTTLTNHLQDHRSQTVGSEHEDSTPAVHTTRVPQSLNLIAFYLLVGLSIRLSRDLTGASRCASSQHAGGRCATITSEVPATLAAPLFLCREGGTPLPPA
jgi:hypothetical protein